MKNRIKKLNNYKEKIKNNNFYKNLFKNSFWAFSGDAAASVLNLIITIILIKITGNYNYGILVLAQSYMSIIDTVLNVQCWKSVIQFGQKAIVEKNTEKLNSYVLLGTKIDIVTAILGGIVATLLAPVFGNLLGWSQEAIMCAQIFSVTIFSHLSGTSTAILRILDKFHLVAFQKFLTSFIKLIIFIVLLLVNGSISIITAAIAYCTADIVGNLLLVVFALSAYSKKSSLGVILKSKKAEDTKEFVKFTLWGTAGMIVDIPINYLDVFIVSLLGNDMVAVFKVFKQCAAIIKKVTSAIQQAIMPQFSELVAKGEKTKAYNIVIKTKNIILKIMLPAVMLIGITAPIWLDLLYGKLYANNWYALLMYLIVEIVALSYTAIHPLYIALNKVKKETFYVLFANIIYALSAIILVKTIGIMGMIAAIAVQCFIVIYLKKIDIQKEINKIKI